MVWQNSRDMRAFLWVPWALWRTQVCFVLKRPLWGQPQTSLCGPPSMPSCLQSETQLPEIVGSFFVPPSPNTWAFGSQWTTVFTEVLWHQLSADSSGRSFCLEHPSGPLLRFTLKVLHCGTTQWQAQNEARPLVFHWRFWACSDATRTEPHPLVTPRPSIHSYSSEWDSLQQGGELWVPTFLFAFISPESCPALRTDKANYSLGRMCSHTFGAGN